MNYDVILNLVQQYGYAALFFSILLGVFFTPIPDEVLVMTGGLITSLGLLAPIPALAITYMGVTAALTLCYLLGKQAGSAAFLPQNFKSAANLSIARVIMTRFSRWALLVCYFLPFVRHLVQFLVGVNKMPYYKYALYSYSGGLMWTSVYFLIGRFCGNNIEMIAYQAKLYGMYLLLLIILGVMVRFLYHAYEQYQL